MKLLNKIKNFLEMDTRVLDLEVDKEIQEWTLERFYKIFQYNYLSELSELKIRLLIRLLQARKVHVSFACPFIMSKPMVFDGLNRILFLDHKKICVGCILDYLQRNNAITIMKRRKEDTNNEKNK